MPDRKFVLSVPCGSGGGRNRSTKLGAILIIVGVMIIVRIETARNT
ncbi:MAG: hypothetical protein GX679_01250 [Methanocorpusculum parvum]|nr:hypothetical protein [Methanocorpusculum parvum]